MDNAEEILQALEEFSKLKPKEIPKELEDYLGYVAKTGDPVFQWHLVKHLFHEKLSNVITEFYETSPTIDLPPCPNVDPFNYERMKTSLLERLDTFASAPFTVQRICELLTNPRKQYNRVDKFMRAIEKNILVVSTREPGAGKRLENDQTEAVLNGIPDSKINENEERNVSVCSDNLQFSNTPDSCQVPVENAVNTCIIQEQIEIVNSASTTVLSSETRSWCDGNGEGDKRDLDNSVKTDSLVDNPDINVVSTSSSVTNSELPKSNILFMENESEVKQEKIDDIVETSADKMISSEPIVSSTPDSPDSPEPSNSDVTCEPSTEENNLLPDRTIPDDNETEEQVVGENDDTQPIAENISDTVEDENPKVALTDNTSDVPESTNDANAVETSQVSEVTLNISNEEAQQSDDREEKVGELKIDELSPENSQQPDSSDDLFSSGGGGGGDNSRESDSNALIGSVQNEDSLGNDSSEQITSPEPIDVSSSQATITIQEVEGTSVEDGDNCSEDLVVKEVIDEDVDTKDSPKTEGIKESVDISEDNIVINTNEDAVASSDECVSIEEITEIKDGDESSNTETGIVVSSNEILDELCEQERREGSIIHVTPNLVQAEQSNNAVEDICVDQSSVEEEAMDIDETSNQPMVMSEGETEAEPMDQSEQLQS